MGKKGNGEESENLNIANKILFLSTNYIMRRISNKYNNIVRIYGHFDFVLFCTFTVYFLKGLRVCVARQVICDRVGAIDQ